METSGSPPPDLAPAIPPAPASIAPSPIAPSPIAPSPIAPPPAVLLGRGAPAARPRELIALIAIIALADLGLYQSSGGLGCAVMLAGVPAVLAIAAPLRGARRLAAITALLGLVALRCLWQASLGATLLGLGLVLAFAIAQRTPRSFLPELLSSALGSVTGAFRQLGGYLGGIRRVLRPWLPARTGALALYIPALLVVVFGAIFAAANPAIQAWLGRVADVFDGAWSPAPGRAVFWVASAVGAAALLRPLVRAAGAVEARLGTSEHAAPSAAHASATHLAIARNGMVALNVLFLGYNALDAMYLWAGRAPDGVRFTDYAHAGAAWLTIAFLLSTIVLGAMFRGAIVDDARGRFARGLAYVWAGQNFVLAAGTFRRIQMYIAYSGLTELRIVGILGTALTALGLAIVVFKIARGRTMLWVVRRQLDALAVVCALYVVAPTGLVAMRYNVARISADQYRPLLHLYQQAIGAEAVPALLPLLRHPDPQVRAGVAVLLIEHRDRLRHADDRAMWFDVELARTRALAALDDATAAIAAAAPSDPEAAESQLRAVAFGINAEVERPGDDGPFDWRVRHYDSRN